MDASNKKLIVRQEIYDSSLAVQGYELFYQVAEHEKKPISQIINEFFTNLNHEIVIGKKPAFINLTRWQLFEKNYLVLARERYILNINETFIDQDLCTAVKQMVNKGYKIALNDFVYSEALTPLIELAEVIKIDVFQQSAQLLTEQLANLNNFKGKLLAKRIVTPMQYQLCQRLGFNLFHGSFVNQPVFVQNQELVENKKYLLKFLIEVHDQHVKIERVENIIFHLPKLNHRIMRLVNSCSMYAGRKIESLLEAIQQLGIIQIRNWLSLILIASLEDVDHNLLERAVMRARMCQSLAKIANFDSPNQAYTLGLFSLLDVFFNLPMTNLLSLIHISKPFNEALLHRSGLLGSLLENVQNYEDGCFNKLQSTKFTQDNYWQAYIEALSYTREIMNIIF